MVARDDGPPGGAEGEAEAGEEGRAPREEGPEGGLEVLRRRGKGPPKKGQGKRSKR